MPAIWRRILSSAIDDMCAAERMFGECSSPLTNLSRARHVVQCDRHDPPRACTSSVCDRSCQAVTFRQCVQPECRADGMSTEMAHINAPAGTAGNATGSLSHPQAGTVTHTIDGDEEYVPKRSPPEGGNGVAGPVGESSSSEGLRAIPLGSESDASVPNSPARVTTPRSRGQQASSKRSTADEGSVAVRAFECQPVFAEDRCCGSCFSDRWSRKLHLALAAFVCLTQPPLPRAGFPMHCFSIHGTCPGKCRRLAQRQHSRPLTEPARTKRRWP